MNKEEILKIVREDWFKWWNEESKYCEQKYLTPDTHSIITEFISLKLSERISKKFADFTPEQDEVLEDTTSMEEKLEKIIN